MIDDHLIPAESAPAPSRRDRTLESLGGSTRLELGLGGATRVLRRRGLMLIAIFAISFILIYALSGLLAKRYSSVAWIKITDQSQNLFDKAGSSVDVTKEQKAVVLTLESPRLSDYLRKHLGGKFTDVKSVLATGLEASPLIRVDSSAASPTVAEQAADDAAQFAVNDRRTKVQKTLSDQATALDNTINGPGGIAAQLSDVTTKLNGLSQSDAQRPSLEAQQAALQRSLTDTQAAAETAHNNAVTADGGLEIYEEAIKPADADFPKPMSWAILGSLAMLMISIAVVYGREELVGRFHSGDASESRRAGARVLGVLPNAKGRVPRGVVTGAATTVDEVGLQLVHLLGRNKPNVVVVCGVDGPAPEETTRRIAQAIAESGARVVYAACRGVAATETDEEFEAPVPRARLSVVHEQQTGGRLRVLDDGIPVAELTVARARTVLRRLTEQCEYVVIAAASPTVEPATLVLAELADATLMIAQHGETKLRDAERAGTRLRRVGGAVLGVIADPEKPGPASATFVPRASGVSTG
ncbi:MAG: hypothetical protein ACXVJ7_18230 [Acidimicrobiia bacterium]